MNYTLFEVKIENSKVKIKSKKQGCVNVHRRQHSITKLTVENVLST
jgi:hypothetical protein